ncbi:hypothetical protein HK097_008949 [Rhizophlyctis rosea]|uniref:Uncharacterized protein n=1 Tax=Rhizophlyctis rosea TaxID=64517 RepID=A0AAD5SCB4_9FUNG|nr:hypothetical protein HK097_008949 [Rhizophlyctis rosea]
MVDQSEIPSTKPACFVIELCQQVLATSFRTSYQLDAPSPEKRLLRNQQVKKLIATWGTCDLWLKLFPGEGGPGEDTDNVLPSVNWVSSKVEMTIEEIAALESMETWGKNTKCQFGGAFDEEAALLEHATESLKRITPLEMDRNIELPETSGFIYFILTRVSTLRSLYLAQDLMIPVSFPRLENPHFELWGNANPFLELANLKHLRIYGVKELALVAPLTTDLRILEGHIVCVDSAAIDAFHAALKLLPAVQVLAIMCDTFFGRDRPVPMHLDFYRSKGRTLTGLFSDAHVADVSIMECVAFHCEQLTHLAVSFPPDTSQSLIRAEELKILVHRCPKLEGGFV